MRTAEEMKDDVFGRNVKTSLFSNAECFMPVSMNLTTPSSKCAIGDVETGNLET